MVPAKKHFLAALAVITLIAIAGCGGGNSVNFPPPQGAFTNANLNGPFAFSYTGSDAGGFLAVAGSFIADGAGHITSGTQDINSGVAVSTNIATSGTYLVRADGRGTITLNSPAGNSTLDFVLVAGGHALVTRFDNRATGSGTIDQQTTFAFSNAALAGPFAFTLSGIDTGGVPVAVGGVFTSDASGNITSGVDDSNDNGVVVTNDPMTGSIPVASTGRGIATLNTVRGTLSFAYYVVDATHLKIVGTNTLPALGGEAFSRNAPTSNASVSGPFAFTLAGADLLNGFPFAAGGVVTSDGAGNVTAGIEDFNDGGSITTAVSLTGTYAMAPNGRGTMTLNTAAGTFSFVIYPSTGGVQVLEIDSRFLTSGAALQQQTTPFTAASFQGTYGMNFDGAASGGSELDSIAEFTADGVSKLSGIIDINNSGGITFGQSMTGTFVANANGRNAMSLQTPLGPQSTIVYLVNANRALFIEVDGGLVAAGDIRHQ